MCQKNTPLPLYKSPASLVMTWMLILSVLTLSNMTVFASGLGAELPDIAGEACDEERAATTRTPVTLPVDIFPPNQAAETVGGIFGYGGRRVVSLERYRELHEAANAMARITNATAAASEAATASLTSMQEALTASQACEAFLRQEMAGKEAAAAAHIAELEAQLHRQGARAERYAGESRALLATRGRFEQQLLLGEQRERALAEENTRLIATNATLETRVSELARYEQELLALRADLAALAQGETSDPIQSEIHRIEKVIDELRTERDTLARQKAEHERIIADLHAVQAQEDHFTILWEMIHAQVSFVSDDRLLRKIIGIQEHFGLTLDDLSHRDQAGRNLRWALINVSRPRDEEIRHYNNKPDRHGLYHGTLSTTGTIYEGRNRLLGNDFTDGPHGLGFGKGTVTAKIGQQHKSKFATEYAAFTHAIVQGNQ